MPNVKVDEYKFKGWTIRIYEIFNTEFNGGKFQGTFEIEGNERTASNYVNSIEYARDMIEMHITNNVGERTVEGN